MYTPKQHVVQNKNTKCYLPTKISLKRKKFENREKKCKTQRRMTDVPEKRKAVVWGGNPICVDCQVHSFQC
jgi:hypothetical protein